MRLTSYSLLETLWDKPMITSLPRVLTTLLAMGSLSACTSGMPSPTPIPSQISSAQSPSIENIRFTSQITDLEDVLRVTCPRIGLNTVFTVSSQSSKHSLYGCQHNENSQSAIMIQQVTNQIQIMWDVRMKQQATELTALLQNY